MSGETGSLSEWQLWMVGAAGMARQGRDLVHPLLLRFLFSAAQLVYPWCFMACYTHLLRIGWVCRAGQMQIWPTIIIVSVLVSECILGALHLDMLVCGSLVQRKFMSWSLSWDTLPCLLFWFLYTFSSQFSVLFPRFYRTSPIMSPLPFTSFFFFSTSFFNKSCNLCNENHSPYSFVLFHITVYTH